MFEVKTQEEFKEYSNPSNDKKVKQLFSYAMQEKQTKTCSFYSFDFINHKDLFANVFCEDLRNGSNNVDDFYDRWNKIFDYGDLLNGKNLFSLNKTIIKFEGLTQITERDTKYLFNQFLTILRLNSISDKPNAFIRMINLFLSKIADELTEDKKFIVVDKDGFKHTFEGLKFQYIDSVDTPITFMKRIGDLYKEGMKSYLNKEIIDYSDDEVSKYLDKNSRAELVNLIDNLRLKKNNNFSFIEVYDDKTFIENFSVVRDVVKMLEAYKLKYDTKHQFLGDFFEELLNTSLKQEAGQFFTPYPLVDYMINSLPYNKLIDKSLDEKKTDFIPSTIDYASGAGHFLIISMSRIQSIINNIDPKSLTATQKVKINQFKDNPYSWVKRENVVGIEKDYRLAKTSKIGTFLNGDGDAEIIAGDGINKFNSDEYKNTVLYSESNILAKFDFLVSNPPYSVDGFMHNFVRNGIDKNSKTFTLLKGDINPKDSAIEIFFIERMYQLLKPDGWGAIILPQSFLSSDKYIDARKFLLSNFRIYSMLLTADITFSGTTTSPVTLILNKRNQPSNDYNYNVLLSFSPKYLNPNGSNLRTKEVEFLGYEFSSNRSKAGITPKANSILKTITTITSNFINNPTNNSIPRDLIEFTKIVKLSDILLNQTNNNVGDIYPKREIINGVPLSYYFDINIRVLGDFIVPPTKYLEIGNLETQISKKNKKSLRLCKKDDVLVSSLTPKINKITVATDDFILSPAIHVLSFKKGISNEDKKSILLKLKSDLVIKQMNNLLDGFKITYAKISETNLINNILI